MSPPAARILLATDGSEDATMAARAAVDVASEAGKDLHVVHAWHSVPSSRFGAFVRARLKQEAREVLDDQVEEIGEIVAGARLREGSPVDEILDLAEELAAELIVMGSRGAGAFERLVTGSVSEGVVHHASCPVLVVRGAWPPSRVVFADDGSEEATAAGELAARIVKPFAARGVLVRAYPELPEADEEARSFDARRVNDALRREEKDLGGRADQLGGLSGSRPRVRLVARNAARAILEAARDGGGGESTLIAVGSRGLGAARRVRLGSVSTKALRAAGGPVLVVRKTQEGRPR